MTIGDIAILEQGLEDQAKEIARVEAEGPSGPASLGAAPTATSQPLSAAEERQMAIQHYEQQQQERRQTMTSAQRLASMGITVTQGESQDSLG